MRNQQAVAVTRSFFDEPERILGSRLLVLKRPSEQEKGVILLDYSFTFPILLKFYDIDRVAIHYHVVLEPSWSGLCDFDVLCYNRVDCPVFVQAFERRDALFLSSINTNLIPVPLAANWWVDDRVFRPMGEVAKDVDVIMVASWAKFKRHDRLFAALKALREKGERLKVVLVGYPVDMSLDELYGIARFYGIGDQLEMYEWLSPTEVTIQYNRAKVNMIWSRREGVNRAIIEGMFCDVPCLLREGFNYGYRYPYINRQTGTYASEAEMPSRLLEMCRKGESYSPREWVSKHMTCRQATKILGECIGKVAREQGERWTRDLAVKVGYLNRMQYWNEAVRIDFIEDYKFLRKCQRSRRG